MDERAARGSLGRDVPLILTDSGEIRKLTPKETFNVQGYPKSFRLPEGVSNGQLYKQAGNSVVVPVIKRIAENVAKALNKGIGKAQHDRSGNIAIIYIKMNGQFEGESYVKDFVNNEADAYKKIYEEYDGSMFLVDDAENMDSYKKALKKHSCHLSVSMAPIEVLDPGDQCSIWYHSTYEIPLEKPLTEEYAKELAATFAR